MLSTSSSSALPPRVIIWNGISVESRHMTHKHYLVHLFQLKRYQVEASHELVQALLPQVIVFLFLLITQVGDLVKVLSSSQELLFTLLVVLQDVQVRLRIFEFLYTGL